MKDFKAMHRHVIIYLPNGKQVEYATKDLGSNFINVVKAIECEPDRVNIVEKVDGKMEARTYVGMPYMLNMF